MSDPTDNRAFGLSPRARRFVLPFLAFAVMLIAISYLSSSRSDGSAATGPVVGGDLHAVGELNTRIFASGHGGAGYLAGASGWTQIDSLDDKDVMAWASTTSRILAGGHAGLYSSTDDGTTFNQVGGLPVSDVHALGANGDVVYLASPGAGTLVSTDGGMTFESRGPAGQDFMGTIWVDPTNSDLAIAPSMKDGAVRTSDGGATWTPLGSTSGSMAVAVDATSSRLLAIGMNGAEISTDGGAAWTALDVPDGTSAASYTATGDLLVAALVDDRAEVFQQAGSKWEPLG